MKLFLASALDKMKDQLLAEVGSLQDKKIAYCINPADERTAIEWTDIRWLKNDRDMLVECGTELVPVDLRVMQGEELKLVLESCDMLFVSGGDTNYFLKLAHESGYATLLPDLIGRQQKVYLSTSAGSCVMGSFVRAYAADGSITELIPGFWYYQTMMVPHRWRGTAFNKAKYLWQMERLFDEGWSFLALTDYQAIVVEEHWMRIVTAASK